MGKSKKAAAKKRQLVSFVDLREVELDWPVSREAQEEMVQGAINMEIAGFRDLVEKNGLICFNSVTFADLFRIGPPFNRDCFVDVWCPSQVKEAGKHFTMQQVVFVDDASKSFYAQVLSWEKESLRRQEELIKQESKEHISEEKKEKPGSSQKITVSEEKKKKLRSSQKTIVFRDLRLGGPPRTVAVPDFIQFIKARDLICYNRAGFTILYENDHQPQEISSNLHLFLSGREWDEALERDIVYVERLGPQHSFLIPQEEKHLNEEQEEIQEEEQEEVEEIQEEKIQVEDAVAATVGANLWENIRKKGYQATTKEICTAMDAEVQRLHGRFDAFQELLIHRFNILEETLGGRLDGRVDRLDGRLDDLQLSLSRTTERSSRHSFSLFYEKLYGVATLPPITNKILPYTPNSALENVAKLCSRPCLHGKDMEPKPTPKFADVDILLRVQGQNFQSPEVGRVMTTTADEDDGPVSLDLIVVGEVTRSTALSSSAAFYRRPTRLSNDSSSKLLYKFVQLERDILAARAYYNINLDRIGGAAIISPSFTRLAEPKKLATRVLQGFSTEFANLKALHGDGRLWLLDI